MSIGDFTGAPLTELISLKGRPALVTAGGAGIGAAVAMRLAEAGASVVVSDIDPGLAERTVGEIEAAGFGPVVSVGLDALREQDYIDALATLQDRFGPIQIMVNNAGAYPIKPTLETSTGEWEFMQDINLRSAFIGSKLAGLQMIEAEVPGVVVNLSSVAGMRPARGFGANYPAAKAGVAMLTEVLGTELGRHDVRVVGVAPGAVLTPGVELFYDAESGGDREAEIAAITETIPLGRILVADDIARVILFLVSDLAAMVTSQVVVVDGARAVA